MKCTEFLKELTEYLDGTADAALREELDEHMHLVLNTTKKTIEIYRDNKLYELPERLRIRLHEAILSKCKASKRGQPTD